VFEFFQLFLSVPISPTYVQIFLTGEFLVQKKLVFRKALGGKALGGKALGGKALGRKALGRKALGGNGYELLALVIGPCHLWVSFS
jgi:hypothetical protein